MQLNYQKTKCENMLCQVWPHQESCSKLQQFFLSPETLHVTTLLVLQVTVLRCSFIVTALILLSYWSQSFDDKCATLVIHVQVKEIWLTWPSSLSSVSSAVATWLNLQKEELQNLYDHQRCALTHFSNLWQSCCTLPSWLWSLMATWALTVSHWITFFVRPPLPLNWK